MPLERYFQPSSQTTNTTLRSEEHTSELQSRRDLHSFPPRRSSDLPPDRRLEVLDLVDLQRVDAAREVLPAVVADHEHDVALVELARDAHRDARDRATGDAREQALLVEQPARPHERVAVGHEDLAVQQREVDDRRDEAILERAQALHGLPLH